MDKTKVMCSCDGPYIHSLTKLPVKYQIIKDNYWQMRRCSTNQRCGRKLYYPIRNKDVYLRKLEKGQCLTIVIRDGAWY